MTAPSVEVRRAVRDSLADVPDDALVMVACSGGPDSVALAIATRAERSKVGAIVVDHGLREGSADEAMRTASLLHMIGLAPVNVVTVAVAQDGSGPEASARTARYAALARGAKDAGSTVVLLGHTRDDQAETVLLGLARGSGVRSLAGMPRVRGIYRRPLLDLPRDVVRAVVPAGMPLVDDPHNSDDRFTRVRVRHTVLPMLERELGPGVAEALARTADLARDDADALDELAQELVSDVSGEDVGDLDIDSLEGIGPALRSRLVRIWLVDSGVPGGSLTADHVGRVVRLVTHWRGQGAVALPGGVEASRAYGRLTLRPTPPRQES